ncbi:MAG: hypothetical protein GY903_06555 [Fuerstiella sp.]|nr:hypothetical protein [Fuerstiella sp.]MCP4854135.1 hypothetical protein [Fuerstiella sp.]
MNDNISIVSGGGGLENLVPRAVWLPRTGGGKSTWGRTSRDSFRVRSVLSVLLLLTVSSFGRVHAEAPPTVPAPGVLPIICFPGPPAQDNIIGHWQRIKDAHFTLVLASHRYSDADQQKMLEHCSQLGLKAVVNVKKLAPPSSAETPPPGWREEVNRATALFGNHPAVFGYMIRDEPGAELFPQLGRVADAFREDAPNHPVCVNLFPTHATTTQLGAPDYVEYLERFMETVRPPFLSYDHYPLLVDGTDRPDFFLNLELARAASLKYDKPLWTIVQSSWWQFFRTPSAGELRWQVYGALAYGVRGFGYFTYWPARDDYEAVVDYQGNETPLYGQISAVNSEALALGSTLLQLKSTAVFHTGEEIPQGCKRLPAAAALQLPAHEPLIAGFFEHAQGDTYAMVVNRNYGDSVSVEASLSAGIVSVSMVNKRSGRPEPVKMTDHRVSLELPAGGGVLLRLARSSDNVSSD